MPPLNHAMINKIHLKHWWTLLLLPLLLTGCGNGDSKKEPPPLGEKETFTWGEYNQPVRFAVPGPEWQRQRMQSGGLEGVSFQIPRVPAGRILLANYYLLERSHSRTYSNGEKVSFEPAPDDPSIEDVVDRVRFRASSMPTSDTVNVTSDKERTVNGWSAISLDYTWDDASRNREKPTHFLGREIYLVAYEELFVFSVLGTQDDLDLFERVVATVEFIEPEYEEATGEQ